MTAFRLTPGDAPGEHRVELDGHDVSRLVSGVELGVYAHPPQHVGVTVILSRVAPQVDLPDAKVEIDTDSWLLLERLGWTPPKTPKERTP